MEFSVPASVENLELSVPTLLVLTFCKEKPLICIRMQGKSPFVAQPVLDQNRKKLLESFRTPCLVLLPSRSCWKVTFPIFLPQQNRFYRTQTFEKKNRENIVFKLRKLMKLKKLARYARLGKLKDNSFAVELGG